MKYAYYEKWNQKYHITVFGKRLNGEKSNLADGKIVITGEDEPQLYIEQMYEIKTLNKEETINWEKNTDPERMWMNVTDYFKYLVAEIKIYHSNSRGTIKRSRYESAANIRED